MFPALVRYDECERGMVEHALRLVVAKTRREYIYPANHYASSIPASSTNYPAMGQRFRLKSSFVIPDNWTIEEKAILRALKKYGGMVADNGNFFSFLGLPGRSIFRRRFRSSFHDRPRQFRGRRNHGADPKDHVLPVLRASTPARIKSSISERL